MRIELTPDEAQSVANLMDREVRLNGAQAAAIYGNVLRQMIEQAQKESATNEDQRVE